MKKVVVSNLHLIRYYVIKCFRTSKKNVHKSPSHHLRVKYKMLFMLSIWKHNVNHNYSCLLMLSFFLFGLFVCVFFLLFCDCCVKTLRACVMSVIGADPGFSFRGGGAQKIICANAHYEREIRSPFRQGSRARLMLSSAIWALFLSILLQTGL